ncbi:MAG: sugar phosphate isomerase/epimerase [Lachnospiraceae bacterium]|nr:sugar phosphate isomerase/epimerase [Lachnospiraceae bacterium]
MEPAIRLYAFADEASAELDRQIEAMRRNRMDGLEIRNTEYGNVSALTVSEAREIRRKMDEAGLITWSIGSPIGKIKLADPFEPHLALFRHTLEIGEILGAKRFRLFSFYPPKGEDPGPYREEVIERLGMLLDAAEGSEIILCHENEKGIYGDVPKRCRELHEALPKLRAVFDFANFVQSGVNTLEAWDLLKPYVNYIHVKDAKWDRTVVPAGKGEGHVKELIREYLAMGGRDFTLEPHLWLFAGLKDLEQLDERTKIAVETYKNADGAFDAAAEAFREILSE